MLYRSLRRGHGIVFSLLSSTVFGFACSQADSNPRYMALEMARAQLARLHDLRQTTTVETAQTLFNYWNRGIPWDEVDIFATHLVSAQRADVQRMAAGCRSRSVLSVLGDERGMAPALSAVPSPRARARE